jgi:sulfite reductase (ferredoxin)
VRNITACYRAGTSASEVFDVSPYADALFRFLVRNKWNQNLGRKFKITFEGCAEDHSCLLVHDIGFQAVTREVEGETDRGFKVYLAGGLGGAPHLARLYTEFLPEEEMLSFAASVLRVFDRYGERKSRMKARMKFLAQTMGWEALIAAIEEERLRVGHVPLADYLRETGAQTPQIDAAPRSLRVIDRETSDPEFQAWARDSIIEHKTAGYRGVIVRIRMGDLTADRARELAEIVRRFSAGRLRISIEQNIYLPWVRQEDVFDLYLALKELSLADAGAETVTDVTTCPGSDTCRLGIASAKGLGSAISEAFDGPLAGYRDLARDLKVKVSGCPNGCAQHAIANIGFHAAALSHEGRTVPAHLLFLGGQTNRDRAQTGWIVGKFPARNCVKVVETLIGLYRDERLESEDFNSFVARTGEGRLKEVLEPLRMVPSFEEDPSFYEDYGHENERFAVRQGIKGECAGATVAETIPSLETAREYLAQAEALIYHREYEHAAIAAYEAAAAAARVPLYRSLVDPFTSEEALWEFENLFVLSGQTQGAWRDVSSRFEEMKEDCANEDGARRALGEAQRFLSYCANSALVQSA